ncbi:hypothetical protein BV494_08060 [Rahnella sikkimica]|uniref:Uncharacterized protein n=1 Tax=Rahnella sikkimica TaxID=1805933 RepID=A0A2L1UPN8_9GAMM|nr:hypothetical protein BV494_08060 [Rahnella sikkimica]
MMVVNQNVCHVSVSFCSFSAARFTLNHSPHVSNSLPMKLNYRAATAQPFFLMMSFSYLQQGVHQINE